jgi:uncharacterized protein YqhQ
MSPARPYIGGQAVIEGVMMRSPRSFAVVVRRRSGQLVARERPVAAAVDELGAAAGSGSRRGVSRWPFVRGVTTLVEAIRLGSEALRFSSELYEADLEAAEKANELGPRSSLALWIASLAMGIPPSGDQPPPVDASPPPHAGANAAPRPSEPKGDEPKGKDKDGGRRVMGWLMVAFLLVLFVALPQAAAGLANRVGGFGLDLRSVGFQAMTGGFKLAVVVGYLLLIRRIPEIYRVFQYHGAEHKTISTYEAGEALVVANARAKSTLHPRCGTTFLVMVALVSIFVFSAAAPLLPRLPVSGVVEHVLLFALKLPFLPVIAGLTFELQRLSARYCTRGPLRALLWPGFLVQKITTIEPDDSQLEVALASLGATLWRERAEGVAPTSTSERTFDDFDKFMAHPGYGRAA